MGLNKTKRKWVWCKSKGFTWIGRRLKCLVCSQRFLPAAYNCEYPYKGCWHPFLPRHKRAIK